MEEGGGEGGDAPEEAPTRWTCEACGCNTNMSTTDRCGICGTNNSGKSERATSRQYRDLAFYSFACGVKRKSGDFCGSIHSGELFVSRKREASLFPRFVDAVDARMSPCLFHSIDSLAVFHHVIVSHGIVMRRSAIIILCAERKETESRQRGFGFDETIRAKGVDTYST